MATSMVLTNNTGSDIVLDIVGQTLAASSTITLTDGNVALGAGDPGVRAGFSSGAIGVSINGFVLSKDAVGCGVLSDIAYGSISIP